MTFSYTAKSELCKLTGAGKCCAVSECYGILLYCNTFTTREVRVITENKNLGARITALFKKAFSIEFDVLPVTGEKGKQTYIISERDKLRQILHTYGFSPENLVSHHVNLGVLEDECCKRSFMRGVFLAGGSVTNPVKSYHLELVTDHYSVSRETYSLLLEMGFTPKETSRSGSYIVYFKQSSAIEDFLTTIGAPLSAMSIMSAKIEKDMRNSVNRKVNCDTANVSKTVDAAAGHISAILKLKSAEKLDALPEKLRLTANLRLDNPELSIKELADISVPPVTKSCLNHRLRKLAELSRGC